MPDKSVAPVTQVSPPSYLPQEKLTVEELYDERWRWNYDVKRGYLRLWWYNAGIARRVYKLTCIAHDGWNEYRANDGIREFEIPGHEWIELEWLS